MTFVTEMFSVWVLKSSSSKKKKDLEQKVSYGLRSILLEVQRTVLMIQIKSDSYSKQQKIQKFLYCGFQKSETRQSEVFRDCFQI